ncbi:hypothetical protein P280DRAFT_226927 [Massarina eburnea CBS 473.64]|uniref:Uncharacterized protein n=1 Tax=Massarina eburnea CBS 473.64 TaxID=1395130 RepID=A0A6A6SAC5_9PLEO|nr:hypothetical protein P280DRAFT_226927 [Massarina eburnea CBS 473.64]
MSSDRNSPPLPSPNVADQRRASVTGQTFQDLFARQGSVGGQGGAQPYPGPITSAAANAQRRRLSLTTVGLGSPQQSTFQNRPRTESISSANSGSVDESPFEDDPTPSASSASSNPATPFARRLSFGARALRDVRQSNGSVGNPNGRPSIHKASSPPTARIASRRGLSLSTSSNTAPVPSLVPSAPSESLASEHSELVPSVPHELSSLLSDHFKRHPDQALGEHELTTILSKTGEGYNFAENMRNRAERSSVSGPRPIVSQPGHHQRAKSVAIMEPPVKEMPKQPKVPDAMQERILKGDFYMD